MRVLVCGSRTWRDWRPIFTVLGGLLADAMNDFDDLTVIQGGQVTTDSDTGQRYGADYIASHFFDGPCESDEVGTHAAHGFVNHERYPADWQKHGRAAGPIRNKQMLEEGKPDLVVAFSEQPITKGTQNMVDLAKAAGVPVWVVSHG
jgi:hypothetical protein